MAENYAGYFPNPPAFLVTRATLLHVLDRPTDLGPAEVRELEQLAQAFPYCQTAHLLLAKAAHDQGTMLAGQRLRRAATYAADRALLRRLIELVEPAPVAEAAPIQAAPEVAVPEAPTVALAPEPAVLLPATAAVPDEIETVLPPGIAEIVAAPVAAHALPVAEVTPPVQPVVAEPAAEVMEPTGAVVETVAFPEAEAVAAEVEPESGLPIAAVVPAEPQGQVPALTVDTPLSVPDDAILLQPQEATVDAVEPALVDREAVATQPTAETQLPVDEGPVLALIAVQSNAGEEADLPAQAPAIRPPVEVGEARFEFGLAEALPPVMPVYELPGLIDEWAAAATTLSLAGPELLASNLVGVAPIAPVFTPAAFTGDATVGYAFGESSRLGLSMQLLDLLTAQAEAAEAATAVVSAAQPPAVALPPTGTFFEPDTLLLNHWASHRPALPVLPSSLDLINNFLKRQPRLTRPAMLPPAATHQADLSIRSTRAEPDLVSENLARIFVRQGKIARAIEIYEKLMVKHPEKLAYFAAQIQSLQPSA